MAFYYGYSAAASIPIHVGYGVTTGCVPVYRLNVPGGGAQGPPIIIAGTTPVYSSYTGHLVGYGPLTYGTPNDAPKGHPNHGKNFHVIEYNESNGTHMAHRMQRR